MLKEFFCYFHDSIVGGLVQSPNRQYDFKKRLIEIRDIFEIREAKNVNMDLYVRLPHVYFGSHILIILIVISCVVGFGPQGKQIFLMWNVSKRAKVLIFRRFRPIEDSHENSTPFVMTVNWPAAKRCLRSL